MPVRTRTNLAVLIALLALVMAGSGTAVAAGLAKKNTVTSKAIKNNAIQSKDLKDDAVESVDLKDGSVASAVVKDESLTGADIAEASLGIVPNAIAVGGVQVSPLSTSLASTSAPVQVLADSGNTLTLECTGSLRFTLSRAAAGPPMLLTGVPDAGASFGQSLAAGDSLQVQIGDGQFTVAIVRLGGGGSTAEFTGIYSANALGANDCFYRGTVTRTP